jgi:16S rRNA (cytosine967-C5)-methyltransferase
MTPGARLQAAIEIIDEILNRHRPASNALSEWGKAHRFAGSGDRAAIGNLVYDTLRHRASSGYAMGSDKPRALVLAGLGRSQDAKIDDIAQLCAGPPHAPEPLTDDERQRLAASANLEGAPPWVRGDYPEWLHPSLERAFGARAAEQGQGMAARAPVFLRANTMKSTAAKVAKAFTQHGAEARGLAHFAVRLPAPQGAGRTPNVEADIAHGKGWFEVQDDGSQVAAMMAGAGPREQVMDLCAGAGGKTLAMAAAMQNTGQIYAYDSDKTQLRPIFERLKRAGVRNAQVMNAGNLAELTALGARFDCVLIDAPCTGTGTWRRRPDAKWRVSPENLATRINDQRTVLKLGRDLVKPGGRLVYVTCSVLPEENTDQVAWFLGESPDFQSVPYAERWKVTLGGEVPASADGRTDNLLLTPADHGTDGFFIASFVRKS